MFEFDLNEVPPPEDVDAPPAHEPSPPPPPPPEADGTREADDGMAEASPPRPEDDAMADASIWTQMLDLDVSGDEDEEGEIEIELQPPTLYGSPAPRQSPEKMRRSRSPAYQVVADPAEWAYGCAADTSPARSSSCADVHDCTAPSSPSSHGGRTASWPNSETLPLPPPPPLPFISPAPSSSSGSSASRTRAFRGTSDARSSPYSRRLDRSRLGDCKYGEFKVASYAGRSRPTPANPQRRRHDGGRRSHGEQAMRRQEAPPLRYAPYNKRDQTGHRGNERPHPQAQGNRVQRGDHRGYETPSFRAQKQQGYSPSSASKPFAGQRYQESYAGRQIPAQEVQNGGYRRQYNREPPRGRGRSPVAQPLHPYARDAGQVDGANAGNHHARRYCQPNLNGGNHQARREFRPNLNDGNHQARREFRPNLIDGNHQARRDDRPNLNYGNHQTRREYGPNQKQHRRNGNQNSIRSQAVPVRRPQYYGDTYSSQAPSPIP
nr:uncharacterized protein LOC127337026 [Lolium perenne]